MAEPYTYMRLAALEKQPAEIRNPNRDPRPIEAAQARADSVAAMFGDRAPPAIPGESELDYRKSLV